MAIDYTSRDFESIKQELIAKLNILAPELTNRNESEFVMVMIELFSFIGDSLSYTLNRYANECFLDTAVQRDSVVKLCNLIGYQLSKPKAANALLRFTITAPISYDVIIPAKTRCGTVSNNPIYFETLEINRISAGNTYVDVLAKEGETKNEIIGYSDGTIDQKFELSFTPLLDEIQILLDSEEWNEVTSFFNSTTTSKDYLVNDEDPVTIQFGNGINGLIPEIGKTVFATYRVGGGTIGNVGSATITNILDQLYDTQNNLIEVAVNNSNAAYGGQEKESIEQAKINAPKSFVSSRAVTANDYKNLISLFSDSLYGSTVKSIVERDGTTLNQINISCWAKDDNDLLILPSSGLKTALGAYLDNLSMVGTINNIEDGVIEDIDIETDVYLEEGYSQETAETDILAALAELLKYSNVEPGMKVAISKIIKAINSVTGVIYCDLTTPAANNQLDSDTMPKLGIVTLNFSYE